MINEVWLDEENQIVRQKLIDDAVLVEAPEYFAEVTKLLDKLPRRLAIVDVSETSTEKILTRQAREYIVEHSHTARYEKIAYVNVNPTMRILAKIMKSVSIRKYGEHAKVEFFSSEQKALDWLKEKADEVLRAPA